MDTIAIISLFERKENTLVAIAHKNVGFYVFINI